MTTKSDQIRMKLLEGDEEGALELAAGFHDRGADTALYKRAREAQKRPDFYRAMKRDPDEIRREAIANLRARFGTPAP